VSNYRNDFLAPTGTYMLSHSVGLPPIDSQQATSEGFYLPWATADENIWPQWLQGIDGFREALATLLNSDMSHFCPQTNLSSALTKILGALPRNPEKRTLLVSEQDFPSIAFVCQQMAGDYFNVKYIRASEDLTATQTWERYLSDDVFCSIVTHVQSNTGVQVPVAEITALTRKKSIYSIVDIAQSAGVIPIDLSHWSADFVIGSCVKWLCGGPGAGYLWASTEMQAACAPVDVGWFSHADPFEFDIHQFRYADDALRFWGGTPSVSAFITAAHSINKIQSIGVDNIRAHNLALIEIILRGIDSDRVISPSNANQCGGTLIVNFGDRQAELLEVMRSRAILFDNREFGMRISPHIYNTVEECEEISHIFLPT
jgi:kynureninase